MYYVSTADLKPPSTLVDGNYKAVRGITRSDCSNIEAKNDLEVVVVTVITRQV